MPWPQSVNYVLMWNQGIGNDAPLLGRSESGIRPSFSHFRFFRYDLSKKPNKSTSKISRRKIVHSPDLHPRHLCDRGCVHNPSDKSQNLSHNTSCRHVEAMLSLALQYCQVFPSQLERIHFRIAHPVIPRPVPSQTSVRRQGYRFISLSSDISLHSFHQCSADSLALEILCNRNLDQMKHSIDNLSSTKSNRIVHKVASDPKAIFINHSCKDFRVDCRSVNEEIKAYCPE